MADTTNTAVQSQHSLVESLVDKWTQLMERSEGQESLTLKTLWNTKIKQISNKLKTMGLLGSESCGKVTADTLTALHRRSEALSNDLVESSLTASTRRLVIFNPEQVAKPEDNLLVDDKLQFDVSAITAILAPGLPSRPHERYST